MTRKYFNRNREAALELISLHIDASDLRIIERWVNQGKFLNRSAFIRHAIKRQIEYELERIKYEKEERILNGIKLKKA